MVHVQIGELRTETVGIGADETGAAEHQVDAVMEDVGRDAAPEQLHHRTVAILHVDAGPPELEQVARKGEQLRDVVFARGVELPDEFGRFALHQTIRADDAFRPGSDRVIDHQQVVRDGVERVDVAPERPGLGIGHRAQFLVEDPVAQCLRGIEVAGRARDPHAEMARPQLPEAAARRQGGLEQTVRRLGHGGRLDHRHPRTWSPAGWSPA